MDSLQHLLCTEALSKMIQDMASLDFPAYGNIYFEDAPLEEHLKIPLEDGFCIGPLLQSTFLELWSRGTCSVRRKEPQLWPRYGKYSPLARQINPYSNLALHA
jgi:hypothetical protein